MTIIAIVLVLAALLFFLELILPGGILGVFGVLMLGLATWLTADEFGALWAGAVFLGGTLFSIGFFFLQIKILPKTSLGKSIFLQGKVKGTSASKTDDADLVGQTGEVLAQLTPGGTVKVAGQRFDAISRDGLIEPGETIEVVARDAFRLVVRKKV